jgi:hypothetical protein
MRYLLLVALAACNPYLMAESAAPPGRAARLDEVKGFWGTVKSYRLELSRGVAIAITCNQGTPCEHVRAVSDNPAIAEVRAASLGVLEKLAFSGTAHTSSALVIVGKTPGTTRVHVRAAEGDRDIAVTIVGSPDPTLSKMAAGDPAPAVASDHAFPGT